jgi:murein DD-endopeptidase MepM/ murein hydrolase activator NlpD
MLKVDQNSVDPRPAAGERFRPADFGGGRAIAQGAEDVGRGLGQLAEGIDRIDQMYDEAAVKRADAEDLKEIIKIKTEALSATGFDAQTAVANARQQIADLRKKRLATMRDGRQQRMYTDVFDARGLQIEESFGTHLVRQVREAEKNAAVARAETYRDLARDSYGTDAFDTNLATALNEISTINRGADPAVIGLAQSKLRSEVYAGVVDGMLANPDNIQEAQLALNKHAADILPEHETALRKKLNPLIEEDQTEADAGWAFTNSPTGEPQATEGPDTPPRPSLEGPSSRAPAVAKPVSPSDPLRGKGRVTETATGHRLRGSGNALDVAAPAGTPIYAPMSGKVIKNWWSEEGGWSMLVEHPNGYVTGYAHMRSQSPLKEGSHVEQNIPIGSVGSTGTKSTGPHVHYTVRQSRAGPKVDPNSLDWDDTVKPESVDWKEGPLVRFEPEENNLGRVLGRLHDRATREGWSNRRYQNAVTRVRQISGVQEQLYSQRQEELWDNAIVKVVELGDGFTSRSQVPGFGLLDPQRQLQLDGIIKSNLTPSEEGKANGPQYLNYLRQSYENREQFLKDNRFVTDPNITNGERARLYERWLQLTQDPNGKLAGNMNEAMTMATRFLPKDYENRGRFMDRYLEAIETKQRTLGRELTGPEKLDAARALTIETVRFDAQGNRIGEGFTFETRGQRGERAQLDIQTAYEQIAPATRDRIIAELKRQGRTHSARAVVEVYLQEAR